MLAFQNEVKAQTGKALTEAQGNTLLSASSRPHTTGLTWPSGTDAMHRWGGSRPWASVIYDG